MQKIIKKIISIIIIFVLGIYLLQNSFNINNIFMSNVLADDKVKPGDQIDIPSSYPQHVIYENNYSVIEWKYTQKEVYGKWIEQGRKTVDDGTGLCYITAGGVDWALVAVAPTFGQVGDYLKVHVKDKEGKEKDYYMIICDIKNPEDSTAYNIKIGEKDVHFGHSSDCSGWNGHCDVAHGHSATGIHLNVLEFVWNWSTDCTKLCQLYTKVQYIVNGGNYFENPDGPIGFTIGPDETNESNTFAGACGTFFRQIWDGLATFMDNSFNEKNKATSLYSLNTIKLNNDAWVWPYPGCYAIGSYFGPRPRPTAGASTNHKGLDIGGTPGDIEVAARSGTVIFAGWGGEDGTGYCIQIRADDTRMGDIVLIHMHCDSEFLVSVGDHVYAGQPIAMVGNAEVLINKGTKDEKLVSNGPTTGPHLHFQINIDGVPVNPLDYVAPEDDTTILTAI